MPSTGFHSPSTITQESFLGAVIWTDPDNAKTDNDQYAHSTLDKGEYTYSLFLTNYNFTPADIPVGSNIDGVIARIWRNSDLGNRIYDFTVRLWRNAGEEGLNLASGIGWPAIKTSNNYGGESNLWNICDLSEEDVRAATFGIKFIAFLDLELIDTAYIDVIELNIYYSAREAVAAGPCISLSNRLSIP